MRRARFSLLIVLLALAGPASAEEWKSFVNGRFGAAVEYPARFLPRSGSGNGRSFGTADRRATLWVFGFLRSENQTPEGVIENRKEAGVTYSQTTAQGGAVTLAGRNGQISVYERCLHSPVAKEIYVCFTIEYPVAEKKSWDPIVARIAASLRAEKPYQADR